MSTDLNLYIARKTYKIRLWHPDMPLEEPRHESYAGVDTETEELVSGAEVIPVLLQVCYPSQQLVHLVAAQHMREYMRRMLTANPGIELVFHTAPFDLYVLGYTEEPLLQSHLAQNLITDVSLRYVLTTLDIGTYMNVFNLAHISKEILGISLDKDKAVRLTFKAGAVIDEDHALYAAKDSIITAMIRASLPVKQPTEDWQVKGYMALTDISRNGLLVDAEFLVALRNKVEQKKLGELDVLNTFGWYPGVAGNSAILQEVLENIEARVGFKFPRTPKSNNISIPEDLLQQFDEDTLHPFIASYKEYKHLEKMLSTYLGDDLIGADGRVHPRFVPILRTGRTSCSGPPLQTVPKKDDIRGVYVAPKGKCLASIDYAQLELCALAQHCLVNYGQSKMADLINAGADLHMWFGKEIIKAEGEDPDTKSKKELKHYRQIAKACYSADTELLTPDGWVKISELYDPNNYIPRKVAQYNPHTKAISFAKPTGWIQKDNQKLIEFTSDSMDCAVTEDHRMLAVSRSGYVNETLAKNYNKNDQLSSVHAGFLYQWDVGGYDIETRLAVMIQADGNFSGNRIRFGFSKQRKITRCTELLTSASIPFTRVDKNGVTTITCVKSDVPKINDFLTPDKQFQLTMVNSNAFIDELWRWDGSTYGKHGKQYFNNSKQSIDFAQLQLITHGHKTHLYQDSGGCYALRWYNGVLKKNPMYARLSGLNRKELPGTHTVYCCAVPDTWLFTRRNNKVTVQGNCNFGYPGGLGPDTFVTYAKGYGLKIDREAAANLKKLWLEAFPEMSSHLKPKIDLDWTQRNIRRYIRNNIGKFQNKKLARTVKSLDELDWFLEKEGRSKKEIGDAKFASQAYMATTTTGRVKRNCTYCASLNLVFQGLSADGAKMALWMVYNAGYKIVNFIHELIVDIKQDELIVWEVQ